MSTYHFRIYPPGHRLLLLTLVLLHMLSGSVKGQTFSSHQNAPIGSNCNGFYDYLPTGYSNTGTTKFPLLIALHGEGELGNGNTELVNLTTEGIPKLINTPGAFPASFTVSSGTYSFVVFAPQFISVPAISDIDAVVQYALSNYNIDPTRVYITGYSMGGGAVWEYSGNSAANGNIFAAIVPVSGAFPTSPDHTAARVIATDNLPVWATHNNNDPTVPSSNTITMIGYINQAPAPVPAALMTLFNSNVHDAWTKTYDPTYIDPNTGFNMYEWMLQYKSRPASLPVLLSQYNVSAVANQEVLIDWATSEEENNDYFSIDRSADGIHFNSIARIPARNLQTGSQYSYTDVEPLPGVSYYRLSQTDFDQKTTDFAVKQIVLNTADLPAIIASPNPASGPVLIQLNFPETGNINLRIINTLGLPVRNLTINKVNAYCEQTVSLADLAAGLYIIQVAGQSTHLNFGLLKQ